MGQGQKETKTPDKKNTGPAQAGQKVEAPLVTPEPEVRAAAIYDPKADDGWQILDTGEGRCYWHLDPKPNKQDLHANVIVGTASDVDSFEIEDPQTGELRMRLFVKVALSMPCYVVDGDHKDNDGTAIPFLAPKGTLVWVGLRYSMEGLYSKVKHSRTFIEIQLKGVERKLLQNGRSVWRIAQAVRATKKLRIVDVRDEHRATGQDDSEVPF